MSLGPRRPISALQDVKILWIGPRLCWYRQELLVVRRPKSIDFYLQAGLEFGYGHLARVARLTAQFRDMGWGVRHFGELDPSGVSIAEKRGITLVGPTAQTSETLVIDSVEIVASDEAHVTRYKNRIVLSPTFRRMELASHLFLRSPQVFDSRALRSSVDIKVDERFGFAGIRPAPRRDRFPSELRVGVCMSAGKPGSEWAVAQHILTCGLAYSVHVLSRAPRPSPLASWPNLVSSHPLERPWDFLQGINVFLGGHGVMVAEAIMRGLPTIAFGTPSQLAKNQGTLALGLHAAVDLEGNWRKSIEKLFSDVDYLSRLGETANQYAKTDPSNVLADEIVAVAQAD